MRLLAGGREVAGQSNCTASLVEWLKLLVLKVQRFSCFELAIDLKGILISHFLSACSIEFAIVTTTVPI